MILKEGLATGPVLFACAHDERLLEVVERRFGNEGDIEMAREAAEKFGIETTRRLALMHLVRALEALDFIEKQSFAYSALASLAINIYGRAK